MGIVRTGRFLLKQFVKRNTEYRKTASSGKDLVIYCGHTKHQWNPELFKTKGFGGSEEAVIYLTRELAKLGWDITVYNNCGHKPLVTGVFVKSQFHRSLYPNVPDRKIAVIPNGLDFSLLRSDEPKDPYLLINTSSADRSLDVLPKLFKEVKRRVPKARLQWAYGWDLFALFNAHHPDKLAWMEKTRREMEEAGVETLGHLTQAEVGKLYGKAAIFAYPTEFPEIDCISARKAQACGCVPVTSDFGALAESVQFGIKVPCVKRNIGKPDGRFHLGMENVEAQRLWVDVTVDLLTNPAKRSEIAIQGASWARQFGWPQIAARWHNILSDQRHFAATA